MADDGGHDGSGSADRSEQSSEARRSNRVTTYAAWVIRWRWPIILLALMAAVLAASGARFLSFSTDYRVFFSEQNPQLQAFEELQNIYTKDDALLFVVKPAEGKVFTPSTLKALRELTEAAWRIPYAMRVDSLTNFQHSFAEGDDLTVRDLVPDGLALTPENLAQIQDVALNEPLLINRMVSPDATTAAVAATLTMPQKSPREAPEAMAYVRDLVAKFQRAHPDLHVAVTGLVALNNAFSEASVNDLSTLVPLMYGVLLLTLLILLRSVSGVVTTVAVIGLSAGTAMGLAGWLGIKLTPPSAVAPTIILTLAVADSVHLLVTLFGAMRGGMTKRDAIVESLRVNFHPVFLTSLTTMIGFLSLNFSDAPPFRDLGNITSMGVIAAWFYSVLFLPALMAVLPLRVKPRANGSAHAMERLAEFVIARRRPLMWGMTGLVVALAVWIPRIELNDQFVNYFEPDIQFRVDTDFAMENLSGIYQLNFSIDAGQPGGISEPDYLARLGAFTEWLRAQPGVVHVQSLTDTMRRLNKNMHGDDPSFYRLPEERDLAAQYLLLFEMSLPYGLDLNNQINVDKSASRVIATLENITTREARRLNSRLEAWLAENMPTARDAKPTGPFVMFSYIAERNINAMLGGTALALVLISFSLILALRHLKLGLLSLVPNMVPAVMAFGVWAITVGELGLPASVVAATSLGIIVDDTVHFLSKYLRARREKQLDAEGAVRYAFSTVGTALWTTSVVLIAGFAMLTLSSFELNRSLGLLTAITIFAALVADFLLLPPLLIALDKEKKIAPQSSIQPLAGQ